MFILAASVVTNDGAGIRLNSLNIVPSDFGISFDNFRTMRRCRLIWRCGDFLRRRIRKLIRVDRVTLIAEVNPRIALPTDRSALSLYRSRADRRDPNLAVSTVRSGVAALPIKRRPRPIQKIKLSFRR